MSQGCADPPFGNSAVALGLKVQCLELWVNRWGPWCPSPGGSTPTHPAPVPSPIQSDPALQGQREGVGLGDRAFGSCAPLPSPR